MSRVDQRDVLDALGQILVNQGRIERKLDLIIRGEKIIMADFQPITDAVAAETTVEESAITLLNQLSTMITDAGTDPVKLQALTDQINQNSAGLAAAVTANTPAVPGNTSRR